MNQIYGLSDRFVADVTGVPLCNYKASGGLFLPWSDNAETSDERHFDLVRPLGSDNLFFFF